MNETLRRAMKSRARGASPILPLVAALLCALAVPARAQLMPESLLTAPQQPPFKWFASTDPKRKNEDYLLLKPGETRRIPLAAGNLVRLWSTASQPEKIVLALQNSPTAARVELWRDNKARLGHLHQKAFTLYPTERTPAAARVLKNGAALVATNRDTQPNKWFYQAAVRPGAAWQPRDIATGGEKPFDGTLAPGRETVFYTARRPLIARSIHFQFKKAADAQQWGGLRLRAVWDKGGKRAVDVPLLSLCGQFGFGPLRVAQSAGWNMTVWRLFVLWPMPMPAGAQLSLLNTTRSPVGLQAQVVPDDPSPQTLPPFRFCAAYGSARAQQGKPVQMLNARGAGAFVGLALGIKPTTESGRREFAYLEGNEVITADGTRFEGTGAEDFFNSAWYFPDTPFSQPLHGLTFRKKPPPQVSAYRLMIPDAVPFKRELNFAFGHGSSNNSNDLEYRWTAFWYQKPPLNFQITDELKATSTDAGAGRTQQPGRDAGQRSNAVWLALGFIIVAILAGFVATSSRRKLRG